MLSVTSGELNSLCYMLTAAADALPGFLTVEIKGRNTNTRNTKNNQRLLWLLYPCFNTSGYSNFKVNVLSFINSI